VSPAFFSVFRLLPPSSLFFLFLPPLFFYYRLSRVSVSYRSVWWLEHVALRIKDHLFPLRLICLRWLWSGILNFTYLNRNEKRNWNHHLPSGCLLNFCWTLYIERDSRMMSHKIHMSLKSLSISNSAEIVFCCSDPIDTWGSGGTIEFALLDSDMLSREQVSGTVFFGREDRAVFFSFLTCEFGYTFQSWQLPYGTREFTYTCGLRCREDWPRFAFEWLKSKNKFLDLCKVVFSRTWSHWFLAWMNKDRKKNKNKRKMRRNEGRRIKPANGDWCPVGQANSRSFHDSQKSLAGESILFAVPAGLVCHFVCATLECST